MEFNQINRLEKLGTIALKRLGFIVLNIQIIKIQNDRITLKKMSYIEQFIPKCICHVFEPVFSLD